MMWDKRYSEAFAAYGKQPNDWLREVAGQIPEGPVLCLAEGEGRNAVFLAARGHEVTAVDQSSVGLQNAAKLADEHGVTLNTITADLEDFDLGVAKWAGIVSVWAHVPESLRVKLHAACVDALVPGGVFVLEAYSPRQLEQPGVGGPPDEALLMTTGALEAELAGLTLLHCAEVERDVQEGRYHKGLSSTVQVLARKPA
jgi:SAM-dependent methyltransferase